jgi:hypothetical protein
LYLVSMQEQVKVPIQVRYMSSLWWIPPLGLAKVGANKPNCRLRWAPTQISRSRNCRAYVAR